MKTIGARLLELSEKLAAEGQTERADLVAAAYQKIIRQAQSIAALNDELKEERYSRGNDWAAMAADV